MRHGAGIEEDHRQGGRRPAGGPAQNAADFRAAADDHRLLVVAGTGKDRLPRRRARGTAFALDGQPAHPAGASVEHRLRHAVGGGVAHQPAIVLEPGDRDVRHGAATRPQGIRIRKSAVGEHQNLRCANGSQRALPVQRRQRRERLRRQPEAGHLPAVEGFHAASCRQRRVDHARQRRHLAHIGPAGCGRCQKGQAGDVVAPRRGQRRQQRAEPEADDDDIRHVRLTLQPVDGGADASHPCRDATGFGVVAHGVAAAGIVELQGGKPGRRDAARQQRQEAAAAQVLEAVRAGDDDAATACRLMQPTDGPGEDERPHDATSGTRGAAAAS